MSNGGLLPSTRLTQAVIDGIPTPVFVIGTDYEIIFLNRAACELSGPRPQQPCYRTLYQADTPCSDPDNPCPLESESLKPTRVVHERVGSDGAERIYNAHAAPFFDEKGRFVGVVESLCDITELKHCRQQSEHLAQHDSLTGLPNRLLALDRLEQALINARSEKHHLAVALLNLDRFHLIIGSLGHALADRALIQVCERLLGCAAVGATVARTGSNEFMLIFPGLASVNQAAAIPKLIRTALRDPLQLDGEEVFLTASVGISISVDDFGTGYSSLAYLKSLPIDTLKIDRSFVGGITTSSDDRVITSMLIDMAHRFDLGVVAEGVETDEQLRFLRAHECDSVQGYLTSRPLSAESVTQLLASSRRCRPIG